jgi:O-methyltransferase domain
MSSDDIGAAVRQVLGDTLGYLYPAALRVAIRLDVADQLAKGPMTAEALAAISGVSPDHLRRVLRFLATRGVFREDDSGAFHLTTAAGLLRSDSPVPLRSIILLFTDEMYWLPAGRLENTLRKGNTVFNEIFGSQIFDYLLEDHSRTQLFSDAMADLSATEHGAIAQSYDFPESGTVVDVAGGLGGMLAAVLTRATELHGVLVEREPVLREHRLDDPAIAGRWSTVAADFFTDVPADADLYLLKRIVHDKSDADAVRILRTCRRAMADHARLLIIDAVVPADAQPSPSMMVADFLMMTVFEGRERTEQEIGGLLAAADLAINRVIPTPTTLSIVEARPA